MIIDSEERAGFVRYMRSFGYSEVAFERSKDGKYALRVLQFKWEGWIARALTGEPPSDLLSEDQALSFMGFESEHLPPDRHPLRVLGALLADYLDDDKFKNCESLILDAWSEIETLRMPGISPDERAEEAEREASLGPRENAK